MAASGEQIDITKVLTSKQEILDYLKISPHLYKKLVRMGLPVLYLDGRCYAHKENLDNFFKVLTKGGMRNAPEELIDADDSDR